MRIEKRSEDRLLLRTTLIEGIEVFGVLYIAAGVVLLVALFTWNLVLALVGLAIILYASVLIWRGQKIVIIDKSKGRVETVNWLLLIFPLKSGLDIKDINGIYVEFFRGQRWWESTLHSTTTTKMWYLIIHYRKGEYGNLRLTLEESTNKALVDAVAEQIGEFIGKPVTIQKSG